MHIKINPSSLSAQSYDESNCLLSCICLLVAFHLRTRKSTNKVSLSSPLKLNLTTACAPVFNCSVRIFSGGALQRNGSSSKESFLPPENGLLETACVQVGEVPPPPLAPAACAPVINCSVGIFLGGALQRRGFSLKELLSPPEKGLLETARVRSGEVPPPRALQLLRRTGTGGRPEVVGSN